MRLFTRRRNTRLQISGTSDAGGKQIHCHGDVRISFVLVAANQLERLVGAAGDLDDRIVVDAAVLLLESFLQQLDHQVGMRVVDAKDQCLVPTTGSSSLARYPQTTRLKGFGDDLAVEVFDFRLISSGVVNRSIWLRRTL